MPVNHADNILSQYWNHSIPVDPAYIALQMGVSLHANQTLGQVSGEYHPFGCTEADGSPTIIYNAQEPFVRQRFTIAHELGHHALRHGKSFRDTSYNFNSSDPQERAANAFAAELLMPKDVVETLIHVRGIGGVEELSKLLQVSVTAVTYRLRNLGYDI